MSEAMAAIRYKYLIRDTDRHGNERWYVRVPGRSKVRIREVPGSEAVDTAYRRAVDEVPLPPRPGRVQPHSLQALVNTYYASIDWRELSLATWKQRRSILNRICREHGERDARSLTSKAVRAGRDARRDTPGAANNMIKTLKALYAWGIEQDLVEHNPATGVRRVPMNPAGFHTWTVDQCVSFENTHQLGTDARMAYELALFAGLRRSDLIRIGRQHVTNEGYLRFTQQKTDREIQILILPPLQRAMDAMPDDRLQFVQTSHGKPYTMPGVGNAMKRWTQEAGLTEHQIAAVLGHAGTGAVKAYTRGADQKRLAAEALRTLGAQSVPLGGTNVRKCKVVGPAGPDQAIKIRALWKSGTIETAHAAREQTSKVSHLNGSTALKREAIDLPRSCGVIASPAQSDDSSTAVSGGASPQMSLMKHAAVTSPAL